MSTFSELVAQAASRAHIGENDPRRDDVAAEVNNAIREIGTEMPSGWGWLRRTLTPSTVADQASYAFEDLLADPTDPPIRVIRAVGWTSSSVGIETWIERRPLNELRHAWSGLGSSIPQQWDAEADTLYLFPTPGDVYDLTISVVVDEPELEGDDDEPLMPARFHHAIVDLAAHLVYMGLQDFESADKSYERYTRTLSRMRASSRQYAGAGAPRVDPR